MVIGFTQLRTEGFRQGSVMGVRNTVPSRIARMVPFGLLYIFLRLYSVTRCAFGVIVAHFTPTPYFFTASAACTVIWSLVSSRDGRPRS